VILAASMALAGGAAAAPSWLVCLEGTGLTKYSNNQCTKAESGGKWQSMELPSGKADTVRLVTPTLTIKDTNTLLGESEVQCYGAGAEVGGIIESPNKGQITEVKYKEPGKNCKGLKVCKETEVTEAKGVNLPWKLELFETETKVLTKILAGTGGKEPGWKVVCKTLGGSQTDECISESGKEEQVAFENRVSSSVLLALGTFQKLHKADCTQGGKGTGAVEGKVALLLGSGNALSIKGASGGTGDEAQPEFRLGEGTSAEIAETEKVNENLLLKATGEPTIECSKMKIEGGVITNDSPEATFKSIHFESCKDISAETTCEVPTIETAELRDTLQEDGAKGETDEDFEPKSGDEIAHFTLKNKGSETCSETKELKIEGDFISKREDNEGSEDEHTLGINVKPESEELKYGDQLSFGLFCLNFGWRLRVSVAWFLFW
jgi:hypothetical protein